jgi:hypothetical protein
MKLLTTKQKIMQNFKQIFDNGHTAEITAHQEAQKQAEKAFKKRWRKHTWISVIIGVICFLTFVILCYSQILPWAAYAVAGILTIMISIVYWVLKVTSIQHKEAEPTTLNEKARRFFLNEIFPEMVEILIDHEYTLVPTAMPYSPKDNELVNDDGTFVETISFKEDEIGVMMYGLWGHISSIEMGENTKIVIKLDDDEIQ